jgi:hypothetical protein
MADSFDNLTPKQLAKLLAAANEKAANSLKDYNEILKQIGINNRTIAENSQDIADADKTITDAKKQQRELLKGISDESERRKKMNSKEYQILVQIVKSHRHLKKELKSEVKELNLMNNELSEAVNSTNLMASSFKSIGRSTKKLAKDFWNLNGAWGEVINWQKEIQKSEKAMGVLSSQAQGFRTNIQRASMSTNQMGINAGELAKMQGAYSEQIGRSVQLSQQGLEAMAEMASGTMLGADGAREMAGNMESFGISAAASRDRVEEMMNLASSMGVNSVKVTENLKKNMKLANRFHFKDGVKGMTRLAAEAAKVRVNMDGIASMADKVFRPEGAVEMASRLQTMGGEFAKMADPFELMFKARNDFEGFTNDIIDASKEFAKFNAETGEFDISGAGLDRIREIADITGMAADDIAKMSRDAAKLERIEMMTNLDDENSAFVASVAEFNETSKQYQVTIDGQTKNINELKETEIEKLRNERQNLKERAKQAQTFDETWDNLKNTFKTILLPVLNGLSEALKGPMADFMDNMTSEGGFGDQLFEMGASFGEAIIDFGKFVKPLVKGLVSFVTDNPITSLLTTGAAILAGKAAMWLANGKLLGMGFNSVASAGGGMMSGGRGRGRRMGMGGRMMKGLGGMFGGKKTKIGKGLRNMAAKRAGGGIAGRGLGLGKGLLRGGLGGLAGAGIGMGLDAWRGSLDDPDSGAGKAMGVGGKAASWAGTGAMIGSIIPGLGTGIGALIGGLAGAGKGLYDEYFTKDTTGAISKYDDVIMRSGQAPIAINPADDVVAAKKDGPIDKAMDSGKSSSGGKMNISFSPINISGTLELTGEGGTSNLDMSDPIFMRDLSKVIQEEVRKAIGGGKMNPNPV